MHRYGVRVPLHRAGVNSELSKKFAPRERPQTSANGVSGGLVLLTAKDCTQRRHARLRRRFMGGRGVTMRETVTDNRYQS